MVIQSDDVIIKAINHEIRREVLKLLSERPLTYTDLLTHFDISTGKLNYHIKLLQGLIAKLEGGGTYELTPLGLRALEMISNLKKGFTEEDQKLVKSAYIARKHTRFPLVLSTIDFGVMALFVALPTIIIGTLIFTIGAAGAFLLEFPGPNALIYVLGGQTNWVNYINRFSWDKVFWYNVAGPLLCSLCLVFLWLAILPRIKPENLYKRLFVLVLMIVLTALGPGSLISWGSLFSQERYISDPLSWYLTAEGIVFDLDLILNIIGVILCAIIIIRLFFYFREVVGRLLDDFHPVINGTPRRKWVLNLSTIAFLGLIGVALGGLAILGTMVLFVNTPLQGSWLIGQEWEYLAYGCVLFGLLIGMWGFNKFHIHKKNALLAGKNFQSFMIGAVLMLMVITVPYLSRPYSSGISFYNEYRSQYWYDSHNGTYMDVISRGDDLYTVFEFRNSISHPEDPNFEGIGLARLDPTTFQWGQPIFLVVNSSLRDEVVGSTGSGALEFGHAIDADNHIWLGYLKSPSPTELLTNPEANYTFVVKGWDIPSTFDENYHAPFLTIEYNAINFSINYRGSPTAWVRAQFDATRNATWFSIIDAGINFTTNERNPSVTLFSLNLTSQALSDPVIIRGINGPFQTDVLNWEPMHFYPNGTVEIIYGYNSIKASRTQPGPDFLQTWSDPVEILQGSIDQIRYEAGRTVVAFNSENDLWLQTYDSNWQPLTGLIRVTKDYQEDHGYLYGDGISYHYLIDATYYAGGVTLDLWTKVGNFSFPY